MRDRFVVYKNGFLGRKPTGGGQGVAGARHINANIKRIARIVLSGGTIGTEELRRSLLVEALSAFGTDNIKYWLEENLQSPFIDDLKISFIEDSFRFMAGNGYERQLNISCWPRLFSNDSERQTVSVRNNAEISRSLFNNEEDADIVNVVSNWLSREGGYEDMAISLNILFGE